MKVRNFFKKIIEIILTKQIGMGVVGDFKIEFEKDVLKLLAKYKCFKLNTDSILQRATIVVDVDNLPMIDLKLLTINHELEKKVRIKKGVRK